MGHPTMQENDTAKLTPTKTIDYSLIRIFIFTLNISIVNINISL